MSREGQLWPYGAGSLVVHPDTAPADDDGLIFDAASGLWLPVAVALVADARFPSSGEKAALAGTNGTAGSGNKYVTNSDPRNTDSRTPVDASVTVAKLATATRPALSAGLVYEWDTDTTSSAPATGKAKRSGSTLMLSRTDLGGNSVTDYLQRYGDPTSLSEPNSIWQVRSAGAELYFTGTGAGYTLATNHAEIGTGGPNGSTPLNGSVVQVLALPATPIEIGKGTAFPTSPTPENGDLFVLDPSSIITATGTAENLTNLEWMFRWNSSMAKWVFEGGQDLIVRVDTAENRTAGTGYGALTTAGPGITSSLALECGVQVGAFIGTIVAFTGDMSYDVDTTGAVDADAATVAMNGLGNTTAASITRRKSIAATKTIVARYKATTNNVGFGRRWMRITPHRFTP